MEGDAGGVSRWIRLVVKGATAGELATCEFAPDPALGGMDGVEGDEQVWMAPKLWPFSKGRTVGVICRVRGKVCSC